MQNLPIFNYNNRKDAVADGTIQTQIRFQPQGWASAGSTASPNQYIRFLFNQQGFWDPKTAYLYIEVDTSAMPLNCVYQLDNSAQGLISQFIARVNGSELERIQEYDSLAALLYDCHVGADCRDSMIQEGVGRQVQATQQPLHKGGVYAARFNTVDPVASPMPTGFGVVTGNTTVNGWNYGTFRPYLIQQPFAASGGGLGFNANNANNINTTINDGTLLVEFADVLNTLDDEGFDCNWMSQDFTVQAFSNNGASYVNGQQGFGRCGTEASVGGGEPWFSRTIPRHTIKGGLPCYEQNTYGAFCIPLLSSIFGPMASHGKLIPLEIFNQLEFEFLLNPYAFTAHPLQSISRNTTGWVPTTVSAPPATITVPTRGGWRIARFEIVVEVTTLPPDVNSDVINRAKNNFSLSIPQYYLGPRIKTTGPLNSSIQVNNGFNSLKMVAVTFQPADFELYPWCRKQKRISNNLSSMQIRVGTFYYPSLPVSGNTGYVRPDSISGRGSYMEFWTKTMQALGKFGNCNKNSILNQTNYTTNFIGYDPTKLTQTLPGFTTGLLDTGLSMTLYWENQIIPRSLVALDMERFDLLTDMESGVDTRRARPFEISLINDNGPVSTLQSGNQSSIVGGVNSVTITAVQFPRPYYVVVWCYYDAVLNYSGGRFDLTGRL